jgi:hypothetical protein
MRKWFVVVLSVLEDLSTTFLCSTKSVQTGCAPLPGANRSRDLEATGRHPAVRPFGRAPVMMIREARLSGVLRFFWPGTK